MTSAIGAPGLGAAAGAGAEVGDDDLDGELEIGVNLVGCDWPPTVSEQPATSINANTAAAQQRMGDTVSAEPVMTAEADWRVSTGRPAAASLASANVKEWSIAIPE